MVPQMRSAWGLLVARLWSRTAAWWSATAAAKPVCAGTGVIALPLRQGARASVPAFERARDGRCSLHPHLLLCLFSPRAPGHRHRRHHCAGSSGGDCGCDVADGCGYGFCSAPTCCRDSGVCPPLAPGCCYYVAGVAVYVTLSCADADCVQRMCPRHSCDCCACARRAGCCGRGDCDPCHADAAPAPQSLCHCWHPPRCHHCPHMRLL